MNDFALLIALHIYCGRYKLMLIWVVGVTLFWPKIVDGILSPQLEYVDLEEFLTENGIPMDPNGANAGHNLTVRNLHRDINTGAPHHNIGGGIPPQMINSTVCMPPIPPVSAETQQMMAGPSRINHHGGQNPMRPSMGRRSRSPSPSGSASSGISHDMSSDTSPDSSQTGGTFTLGHFPCLYMYISSNNVGFVNYFEFRKLCISSHCLCIIKIYHDRNGTWIYSWT